MHLKYFVSVIDAGSMTSAAKKLYISQPALSKQLGQLEKDLNCELLLRKTTGNELTEAGRHLYHKATQLLKSAEELSAEMDRFSEKNTLKLGALPSIGSFFLPAIVNELNNKYKVELFIRDTTEDLVQLIENNHADFVFVQDASPNRNIILENLFWEPYDALIGASVDGEEGSEVCMEEFIKKNLILHKHPCDIRTFFEDYCKTHDLNYKLAIELETNESIVSFVSSGLGSSILPRMVSKNIRNEAVMIKPFYQGKIGRSVDILFKPSLKKIARELIGISKERFEQNF
ncbi:MULTISPECIES: LysR family transcriptional regulator [unclassified Bacillus (in: firmicutes)]|uniref:LysR family transcriptional regulator n=1 Tax=unclassified Bacillus (in: firmicutes) TaxID=185979 RepID=UPI001587DCF1|nr:MULTISPECIES: LysR family transcriptional regulator [unclassified Bacillus (in: firmicutes)]